MATQPLFRGTAPALVTPFTTDGKVDEAALLRLIDRQIEGGVDALVVLGTTGENATIWPDERRRIVDLTLEHVNGRVPVIIGTGNNSTSESLVFSREAARSGANGLLIVGPYYNKPPQAGFRAHVAAIAEAVDTPIILYNVPGRTGFNMTAETVLRLAEEIPTVVGIKEASGNLAQISDILAHRPPKLAVYAGDDEMTLPLLALGADGVISVVCNALPERFSALVRAGLKGDFEQARRIHFELLAAMRACFYDTNPIPIKAVLHAMGLIEETVRLPLVPLDEATRRRVLEAFEAFLTPA
ncbi:4-hydroxy-tetrahydrodipicolinate synthase [Rhodothermus bifroesti]|uniref:4-hydroxy-tetrahydrodipicolinate synthase n=1 Tax=Rhodothermus marinus TaxID=29549 RepID=A0A7V2AZD2_RHOMR|nr:4-hydroxy-tetrahydrodipicolinate synthase [Rhodothermus bifroesti]GBD02169.1 4-hydroxy-tetrahydrodipicolinate synthase [bacterium HR18]